MELDTGCIYKLSRRMDLLTWEGRVKLTVPFLTEKMQQMLKYPFDGLDQDVLDRERSGNLLILANDEASDCGNSIRSLSGNLAGASYGVREVAMILSDSNLNP